MKKVKKRKVERHHPSKRATMERQLGKMLLKGKIPVVPPSKLCLPRCPVPSTHEAELSGVCKDYEDGKISYDDVLAKLGEVIKKPEQSKPEGETNEKSKQTAGGEQPSA